MILAIPIALFVLLLIIRALVPVYRRYRIRAELRRDWWPRFDRELREYMSQTWQSAREAERKL